MYWTQPRREGFGREGGATHFGQLPWRKLCATCMAAFPIQRFFAVQQKTIVTALQRSPVMAKTSNRFSNFFSAAARSINFAREAQTIYHTSDDVFVSRGTTRQQALRDLIDQL